MRLYFVGMKQKITILLILLILPFGINCTMHIFCHFCLKKKNYPFFISAVGLFSSLFGRIGIYKILKSSQFLVSTKFSASKILTAWLVYCCLVAFFVNLHLHLTDQDNQLVYIHWFHLHLHMINKIIIINWFTLSLASTLTGPSLMPSTSASSPSPPLALATSSRVFLTFVFLYFRILRNTAWR